MWKIEYHEVSAANNWPGLYVSLSCVQFVMTNINVMQICRTLESTQDGDIATYDIKDVIFILIGKGQRR